MIHGVKILSIEGIPKELNVHLKNFRKDASEVDYNGTSTSTHADGRSASVLREKRFHAY